MILKDKLLISPHIEIERVRLKILKHELGRKVKSFRTLEGIKMELNCSQKHIFDRKFG